MAHATLAHLAEKESDEHAKDADLDVRKCITCPSHLLVEHTY